MKAILEIGGTQHLVEAGSVIRTELVEHADDNTYESDKVLCIYGDGKTIVGTPHIKGARVKFTVKGEGKGKKIYMRTYKRRKMEKRTLGHRQRFTELKVEEIIAG